MMFPQCGAITRVRLLSWMQSFSSVVQWRRTYHILHRHGYQVPALQGHQHVFASWTHDFKSLQLAFSTKTIVSKYVPKYASKQSSIEQKTPGQSEMVQLFDASGLFIGKMSMGQARNRAVESDLKLVLLNKKPAKPNAKDTKSTDIILSYTLMTGKQLFEAEMAEKPYKMGNKRTTTRVKVMKERIADHDLNIKLKAIRDLMKRRPSNVDIIIEKIVKGNTSGLAASVMKRVITNLKDILFVKVVVTTKAKVMIKLMPKTPATSLSTGSGDSPVRPAMESTISETNSTIESTIPEANLSTESTITETSLSTESIIPEVGLSMESRISEPKSSTENKDSE